MNGSEVKTKLPHILDFAYASLSIALILAFGVRWFLRFFKHNLLIDQTKNSFNVADFVVFYEAGKLALKNGNKQIYDFESQLLMFNQLVAPMHLDKMFAVPYPPHFFLLMAPLACLPLEISYFIWVWGSYALGLFAYYNAAALNTKFGRADRYIFLAGIASNLFAAQIAELGQLTWIVSAALGLFLISVVKNRHFLTGLAFAISTIKPQYACVLGLIMLGTQRWRALAYAAALTVLIVGICALLLGPEPILQYPSYLISSSSSEKYVGIGSEIQVCVRGLLAQVLPKTLAFQISFALFVLAIPYIGWVSWRVRNNLDLFPWAFLLAFVTAIVFLPHCHAYDTLLLGIGIAATLPTVSPITALRLENPRLRFYNIVVLLYPPLGFVLFAIWLFVNDKAQIAMAVLNILLLIAVARYFHLDVLKRLK